MEIKEDLKPEDDKQDRKVDYRYCVVTEVTPDLKVFVQFTDDVSHRTITNAYVCQYHFHFFFSLVFREQN